MPRFITRVELHEANEKTDYDKLHEEMQKEDFKRTILGSNNIEYHLPTAEYHKEGTFNAAEVLASARRAANKTGKQNSVLVIEMLRATWENLSIVKK